MTNFRYVANFTFLTLQLYFLAFKVTALAEGGVHITSERVIQSVPKQFTVSEPTDVCLLQYFYIQLSNAKSNFAGTWY